MFYKESSESQANYGLIVDRLTRAFDSSKSFDRLVGLDLYLVDIYYQVEMRLEHFETQFDTQSGTTEMASMMRFYIVRQ